MYNDIKMHKATNRKGKCSCKVLPLKEHVQPRLMNKSYKLNIKQITVVNIITPWCNFHYYV